MKMKAHFFLVLVGVLGLAGCVQNPADDPRYDTDDILVHKEQWQEAQMPYDIAWKCQWDDIPLSLYQRFSKNGITSIDEMKDIRDAFKNDTLSDYNTNLPKDEDVPNLKKIYVALQAGEFTRDDLFKFLSRSSGMTISGIWNPFGDTWLAAASHGDELIDDLKRIHNGSATVDSVLQVYVNQNREADQAYRAEVHKKGRLLLDEVPKIWWDYGSFRCDNIGCYSTTKITKQDIRDIDQARAEEKQQDFVAGEVGYKQLGMSPHLAYEAMWAMQNRPESDCAQQVRMVTTYERELATGRWNDDGLKYPADSNRSDLEGQELDAIASLERSGVCERKNVLKPIPQEKPYVYNPEDDSALQLKLFFDRNPQQAHDFFRRVGLSERAVYNIRWDLRNRYNQYSYCSGLAMSLLISIQRYKGKNWDESNLSNDYVSYLKNEDYASIGILNMKGTCRPSYGE